MSEYIDMAFFESFTRVDYTGSTDPTEEYVQELIDDSEQEINEVTSRTWGSQTNTSELYDEPGYEILLKNTPLISITVITDGDLNVLTEGIDEDYTIDGNIIVFNKNKNCQARVYVTYVSGYDPVRSDVKMLTSLLTLNKIVQSQSTTFDNTESISVGSISITTRLGATSVVNLEQDTKRYWKRLRRLIR